MTIEELIEKLKAATEGSRELDEAITKVVDPSRGIPLYVPHYTVSRDAALTLYKMPPERMPVDPLKACIEALKQW